MAFGLPDVTTARSINESAQVLKRQIETLERTLDYKMSLILEELRKLNAEKNPQEPKK